MTMRQESTVDDQASQDAEHLRLLSIFHYLVAALAGLWASFPVFHLALGVVMVFGDFGQTKPGEPSPKLFGLFFMGFAAVAMLVAWSLAACIFVAGRKLARRKSYLFCLVVAGLTVAVCMPFGTVLGVFTILVLMRPSVKQLFEGNASA